MRLKLKYVLIIVFFAGNFSASAQSWKKNDFTAFGNIVDATVFHDTIIAISELGYIIKSNDFGSNWIIDSSFVEYGEAFQSMYFLNRNRGYISCKHFHSIINTYDGGNTWAPLSIGIYRGEIGHVLQFTDTSTGYGGDFGEDYLKKTINGGISWSFLGINYRCKSILRVQFFDSTKGYLLASTTGNPSGNDFLFKTLNGGRNWDLIDSFPFFGFGDFLFTDTRTVYLIFKGKIFKSTSSLTKIDTLFQSLNFNCSINDITHALTFPYKDTGFMAFSGSVYKTFDNGKNLIQTNFVPDYAENITCIKAISSTKALAGTGKGNIYITTNGGGIYTGVSNISTVTDVFSIFPNPTHSYLQLSNLPTKRTNLQYSINNILGELKQNNRLFSNNTEENIDVSTLPNGIYFIRLTDNKSWVQSNKFVKE